MAIRVEIVSQDRMVYEGQADIVTLPGIEGEMGILPLHAPLITTLSYGIITVSYEGKEDVFTVAGGIVEVQPDIVTVLADAAESVEEIDVVRAEAARQRAEELLKQAPPTDSDAFLALEAALRRSNLRIGAVRRFRRGRVSTPTDFSGDEIQLNMALFSKELGIDLGTVLSRVVIGSEVVIEEPTVVAIAVAEQKIVEVGREAYRMYGRVPETIEVAWPLHNGVIADYEITEKFLEYLIRKSTGSLRLFRPKVMVTVPYGVTSVESRVVQEATLQAGSGEVYLIQQPLAAALGAELPIGTPSGNMILVLGGGTTQAAVLAMYGLVAAETHRGGGIQLDEAVMSYTRRKFGIIIGQKTAEQIKISVGAAISREEEKSIEVQGQDQVTGLPRPVTLSTGEVVEAIQEPLRDVVETARRVLEKTPPELVSDIIDRGLALCGGGALLPGIDKLLTKELGVPAYLVDNPTTCVAVGAARGLIPGVYIAIRRNLPPV